MNGQRVTAGSASRAMRERYPGDEVSAQDEAGGVRVWVSCGDGTCLHIVTSGEPGMLSRLLGLAGGPGRTGTVARNWTPRRRRKTFAAAGCLLEPPQGAIRNGVA